MALKVRVNTSEARREVETLKKNLAALGSEALDNEKDFDKLERRLRKGLEARTAERAVDDLRKSLNLTRLETAKLQRETGDYTGALRTLALGSGFASQNMAGLAVAAGSVAAYFAAQEVRNIIDAGVAYEALGKSFEAITGSSAEAQEQLEFVRGVALELGMALGSLEQSYKGVLAASQGTALEGEGIEKVFRAIVSTGAVLGATGDQISRVFLQLEQGIGRTRFELEDLKTISEALPGVGIQDFARALNVTGEEFFNMVSAGQVVTDDFLPKLADLLETKIGDAAEEAGRTARAAFVDFGNAVEELRRTVSDSGLTEFFADVARTAAATVRVIDGLFKDVTIDEKIADLEAQIASAQSQLDAGNTSIAISFKRQTGEMASGAAEAAERLRELRGEGDKFSEFKPFDEAATSQKIFVEGLRDQLQALKDLKAAGDVTDTWSVFADGLERANKAASSTEASIKKVDSALVSFFEDIDKAEDKALKKSAQAHEKYLSDRERAIKSFSDAHAQITLSDFDYQVQKLDELYDHYDKYVDDKLALEEWFSGQLRALVDDRDRWMIDAQVQNIRDEEAARAEYWQWYIEKMNETNAEEKREYEDQQEDLSRISEDTWQHITNNMSDTFADALYQMTQGGIGSWGDFLGTMGDMWLRQMAQFGAYDIMSGLGMASGGTGLFTGGESGTGLFGGGDIFSTASTMYSALTGGISATAFDITYGILTPTLEMFGSSAATASAAASSIAGTMAAVAPYLAVAAVAVPLIMDLMENEPTPAIGLISQATDTQPGEGEVSSGAGYDFRVWLQDVGGRSELGETIVDYFDNLFSAIDQATEFSVSEALADIEWDRNVELDKYGGDTEAALAELTDQVFSSISGALVDALVSPDISPYFGTSFFEQIRETSGYETLFEAYVEFAAVVGEIDDFTTEFSRQIYEFGESTEDAYSNLVTIYTALEKIETGLAGITDVSSITTLNDLTDAWKDLITTLKEANDTTERIASTESAMAQVLGANITGLTADSIASALTSGSDISAALETSISGAAYAHIAQTISDSYLSAINEEIGQVWIDSGGDLQMVVAAMQGIDLSGVQADIDALKDAFDLLSDTSGETVVDDLTDQIADFGAEIQDIIDRHTLSDSEYKIKQLGIWFDEQYALAGEIGASTDDLFYAYWLQRNALDDTRSALEDAIAAEEDLIEARKSAAESISDLIDSLEVRSSPVQSMEYYQAKYSSLLTTAQTATTADEINDAISELTSFVPEYLDFAEAYGGDYNSLYSQVLSDMQSLEDAQITEAERQTNELEYVNGYLGSIDNTLADIHSAFAAYQSSIGADETPIGWHADDYVSQKADSLGEGWSADDVWAAFSDAGLTAEQHYKQWGKDEGFYIPSYDVGGISSGPADGYLIRSHSVEAHVPVPSGKIPVELNGSISPNVTVVVQLGNREIKDFVVKTIQGDIRSNPETQNRIRRVVG